MATDPATLARAAVHRRRRLVVGTAGAGVAALVLGVGANMAFAATTLFSDDFESGSTSTWSKSGGTWAVATDGSKVLQQSNAGAENAREFAGDTGWGDYSLQARVKPVSFGSGGLAGIDARVQGSTKYYRLALLASGGAQLQAVNGSTVTVLGSSTKSIATGTWYTLRVDVTGSTITGFVDGTQVASGSNSTFGTGRIGLQTLYAAASFDDVVVTSGGTTAPTSPASSSPTTSPSASASRSASASPSAGPSTTPPSQGNGNASGLVGFATTTGYGRTGTNGGTGGETVTVTSYAALAAAVADDAPRIVKVSGTITGNGTAMLDVGSNKTIIGVGTSATISGFGFDVNGWGPDEVASGGDTCDVPEKDTFTHVQNVIIRNLTFKSSADDSINVQCYSHHVWVDHNTFTVAYDGSVDIKRGSDLVTVSYNRFVGTDKSMLLGHSDGNGAQDTGYLRVTYHHNWMDGSNTRHPRVRFGYAHVYANYVNVTDYFLGLGVSGQIYAESNYVKAAKTITEDFGDTRLTWTGSNFYDPATITRANDSGKTQADWLRVDNTVAAPTAYSYSAGTAPSTPPSAGAGVSGADVVP